MTVLIWIVVVVLVVVLLLTFVGRRAQGGVDPTQLLFEPELINRVRALAQTNQKVAAIRMLRAGTPGLGLASAKVMVDRMAAGPVPPPPAGPDLTKPVALSADEMLPSASWVPLEVELQARSLKSSGQAIAAIKLVREHTSWGLREAKDYVDGL
ncbi:Ribosomal protein L7/L12 C-terminal domain-containing protein [Nakamurella panacisegetis]|uniref:Ribosomal protein L7/L12 C-terminal domain-containing protein n=1 Tax=Nakamurella panacisegetis TaxID=1090615 RepID=A0A1H0T8L8_9ACTN|nr:hypothetical protein [Nakamurella panacisegetis]SDP50387.1 Ribosomal protein L7/L12 C-terminal domain-containing protein [Nakamurella panacisegetis]